MIKMWQFPSLFSEAQRFCSHFLKSTELWKICKTLGGSSPIFAASSHTTVGAKSIFSASFNVFLKHLEFS
jgi:hypothetical protein